MLSRNFRLKKETDFRRIYRKGRRMRGYFFDITYLENNEPVPARGGASGWVRWQGSSSAASVGPHIRQRRDIRAIPNKNTRFGIVVTTKSINKATKRNSAKRILRGIIYKNKKDWPGNVDLIIKIKNEIIPNQKKTAEAELVSSLKKIND